MIGFTGILKYSPIDLGGDGASDVRGFAAYLIVDELRRSSDRLEIVGFAYIFSGVPRSVAQCRLQWRDVDVGDDLNIDADAMRAALGANTLAIIVPHVYGCTGVR